MFKLLRWYVLESVSNIWFITNTENEGDASNKQQIVRGLHFLLQTSLICHTVKVHQRIDGVGGITFILRYKK